MYMLLTNYWERFQSQVHHQIDRAPPLVRCPALSKSRCHANTPKPCEKQHRRKPDSARNCTPAYNTSERSLHPDRIRLRRKTSANQVLTKKQKPYAQRQMPALFTRDTNTPTTMSGENPFQSGNTSAVAAGQENQVLEAQQHKQVLEKKAAADKKYV